MQIKKFFLIIIFFNLRNYKSWKYFIENGIFWLSSQTFVIFYPLPRALARGLITIIIFLGL